MREHVEKLNEKNPIVQVFVCVVSLSFPSSTSFHYFIPFLSGLLCLVFEILVVGNLVLEDNVQGVDDSWDETVWLLDWDVWVVCEDEGEHTQEQWGGCWLIDRNRSRALGTRPEEVVWRRRWSVAKSIGNSSSPQSMCMYLDDVWSGECHFCGFVWWFWRKFDGWCCVWRWEKRKEEEETLYSFIYNFFLPWSYQILKCLHQFLWWRCVMQWRSADDVGDCCWGVYLEVAVLSSKRGSWSLRSYSFLSHMNQNWVVEHLLEW